MSWKSKKACDGNLHSRLQDCEKPEILPVHFVRPFKESASAGTCLGLFRKEIRHLSHQQRGKRILRLVAVNLTGIIFLLIWCKESSSLALLAYSYLSWFNLFSLLTCLVSLWSKSQSADLSYTFGFMRCEILCVFTSVMLTLLGALFIIKESVQRLLLPERIDGDSLSLVALIGFVFNLTMLTLIDNSPLKHIMRISSSSFLQEQFSDMCHSFCYFLPRLKRLLLPRMNPLLLLSVVGFFLTLVDHVMVQFYGYHWGDPAVAIILAILFIVSLMPLCTCSGAILLQTSPTHLMPLLDKCLREALTVDGVLEFQKERFWVLGISSDRNTQSKTYDGSILIGSIHVRARRNANEQWIIRRINEKLNPLVSKITIQVFKDDWKRNSTTLQLLNGSPFSVPINILSNKNSTRPLSTTVDVVDEMGSRHGLASTLPPHFNYVPQLSITQNKHLHNGKCNSHCNNSSSSHSS